METPIAGIPYLKFDFADLELHSLCVSSTHIPEYLSISESQSLKIASRPGGAINAHLASRLAPTAAANPPSPYYLQINCPPSLDQSRKNKILPGKIPRLTITLRQPKLFRDSLSEPVSVSHPTTLTYTSAKATQDRDAILYIANDHTGLLREKTTWKISSYLSMMRVIYIGAS